jgi:hypothetical protein
MIVHFLRAESRIVDTDLTVAEGHMSGEEGHGPSIIKAAGTHRCVYVNRMSTCEQTITPTGMAAPADTVEQGGTQTIQQTKDLCHLEQAMSRITNKTSLE